MSPSLAFNSHPTYVDLLGALTLMLISLTCNVLGRRAGKLDDRSLVSSIELVGYVVALAGAVIVGSVLVFLLLTLRLVLDFGAPLMYDTQFNQ